MQTIEFFEKPGCSTNTTQMASLRAAGCTVAARRLLTHPWTAETLLGFDPVAIAAALGRPAEGFPGTPSCDSGGSP